MTLYPAPFAEFLRFLAQMDGDARTAVERAWTEKPRLSHGRAASTAALAAAGAMCGGGERAEWRNAAADAVREPETVRWAAEGAANEIQAYVYGDRAGSGAIKITSHFFLPMFGFAAPDSIVLARAA